MSVNISVIVTDMATGLFLYAVFYQESLNREKERDHPRFFTSFDSTWEDCSVISSISINRRAHNAFTSSFSRALQSSRILCISNFIDFSGVELTPNLMRLWAFKHRQLVTSTDIVEDRYTNVKWYYNHFEFNLWNDYVFGSGFINSIYTTVAVTSIE